MLNTAAIGLAAIGTVATSQTRILTAQGHTTVGALAGGYELGFMVAASCVAVGLVILLTVLRSPRRSAAAASEEEDWEAESAAA